MIFGARLTSAAGSGPTQDLADLWLDGANLEDANLFGAPCVGTSFARCNLKNANLAYARIEGASFQQAHLEWRI